MAEINAFAPPKTQAELLNRADTLAGMSLTDLATLLETELPANLLSDKGFVGQLIESFLGAQAKSRPEPDFPHLGIELKTLPIDEQGHPLESTYVCTISLINLSQTTWETSLVKRKLSQVLWIPIAGNKSIPLSQRRIGTPLLWKLSPAIEKILQEDWQELTDMMVLGRLDHVSAHHGTYLQVRPKAANARALCRGIGDEGNPILTLPRGFYLRTSFTTQILQNSFILPSLV